MDLVHLIVLLLGVAVGALVTWLAVRARYAAPLAALGAERDALRGRVDELRRHEEDDEAVMAALAPVTSALARVERQVGVLERDRVEQFGVLGERLGEVATTTRALQQQTSTLAGSLNSSTTRGVWGETALRRLLEHAGLLGRCDFDEQVTAHTRHDQAVRPDVVVRLPGGKSLVVDAKAPMTAFLAAQSAEHPERERRRLLASHASSLRGHVETLAKKEYWTAFSSTPEMVVCFVPSDAVLAAALDADPALYDHAMGRRVVLASPATLLALLRTVAFTWQQEALTENARELLDLGRDLYSRLGTLGGHVTKVGGSLRRSVDAYNAMVGALESRVFVTARRMHELGLAHDHPDALSVVDVAPRPLTAAELLEQLDDGSARRDAHALDSERPARSATGAGSEAPGVERDNRTA
ncbi:DNA recombination protein RmuC [Mobilicoccus massiliensis]|uniref:DNA recombination protein RmuC n=1 Tax=Mobilicoccus massiliensis TaxID=1522310 RepID=UPI000693CF4D|nr:DNA recombination protein RmuC [Mobilicoccus massiliensis]